MSTIVDLIDNFRENVRAKCKADGISFAELSRRSSVHVVTISRIMNGHMCPTVDVCEKIAAAAGIRPDTVFLTPQKSRATKA